MKIIEFILKFGFMLGLSLTLLLVLSPLMFETAEKQQEELNEVELSSIHLQIDPVSDNYLQVFIDFKNRQPYQDNIYIPEGGHKGLINFLIGKGLMQGDWKEDLPLNVGSSKLGKKFAIKTSERGVIEVLTADEEYLIGGPRLGRIIFLYALGVIFFLFGIGGLVLTLLAIRQVYIEYKKTGKFPDLPNSIDSKAAGVKFLLRAFKYKK